jgi:hypothetical protein
MCLRVSCKSQNKYREVFIGHQTFQKSTVKFTEKNVVHRVSVFSPEKLGLDYVPENHSVTQATSCVYYYYYYYYYLLWTFAESLRLMILFVKGPIQILSWTSSGTNGIFGVFLSSSGHVLG